MDEFTRPNLERSALLTIDLQVDFVRGQFAVDGTVEVLAPVERLITAFRKSNRPIVHVVRLYAADGSDADLSRRALVRSGVPIVRPGTPGSQLAMDTLADVRLDADLLMRGGFQQISDNESVMYKPRWNAFFATPLEAKLHELRVDTVVIVGCNYPNCPRGTMFGASERDFRVVAVPTATSGWTATAAHELGSLGVGVMSGVDVNRALEDPVA